MIGVVVPAHNEEQLLGECLSAIGAAASQAELAGEEVCVLVVLDSCTDASAAIAAEHGVHTLALAAKNVGQARALGAQWLLDRGARWIACTDADSRVGTNWLVAQLALGTDAVCGTVRVEDWQASFPEDAQIRYLSAYEQRDGHRHIHGANLGFSAQAYRLAGGFLPLPCHEDVNLVRELERCGASIAWSCTPLVVTSARLASRAAGGFGDYLQSLLPVAP